jgi:type IV secretory pathway VirB3-like protein
MLASPLAESEDLICVGFVPSSFVLGVPSELAVFEYLSSFVVKDWARNEHWECVGLVNVDNGVGGEIIIIDSIRK